MDKRLFFAIPLSEMVLATLGKYQKITRVENMRWTTPSNLHITIHFLGNVQEDKILELVGCYKKLVTRHNQFLLPFKEICFAPPQNPCRMIWAEFKGTGDYKNLVERTREICRPFLENQISKCASGGKEIIPHITIARCTKIQPRKKETLPQISLSDVLVDRIHLFQSVLDSNGPVHTILHTFQLEPNCCA